MNYLIRDKLSTSNKLYVYLSELVNGNSCEMLEVDGDVNIERLRYALRCVVEKHDNLRAIIVEENREIYRKVRNGTIEIPIEVSERSFDSLEELQSYLADNIWRNPAFNLGVDAPIKVKITKVAGCSYIQFITTHVWADARSGYLLIADIVNFYNRRESSSILGVDLNSSPKLSTFDKNVQAVAKKYKIQLGWLPAIGSLIGGCFGNGSKLSVNQCEDQDTQFYLHKFSSPQKLVEIKDHAKSLGTTVHSILVPAIIDACRAHDLDRGVIRKSYHLHDLFSVRAYGDSTNQGLYDNFVLPFEYSIKWDEDPNIMVSKVNDEINKVKNGGVFIEYNMIERILWLLKYLPKRKTIDFIYKYFLSGNILCTNPGVIPFEYSKLGDTKILDFYSFSQLFPPGKIMFVFNTFRKVLRISVVYDRNALSRLEVKKIVNSFESSLERMLSNEEMVFKEESTERYA